MKKLLNVHSKLLNKSEIARRLGLSQQTYSDKLTGRGNAKRFTASDLKKIEAIINADLFGTEKIPLENIEI